MNKFSNRRIATYRWEHEEQTGDDFIIHAMGVEDKNVMDEFCSRYRIVPTITIVDKTPRTPEQLEKIEGMKQLFDLAKDGEIDTVLINRMYIFARSVTSFFKLVRELSKYGVEVVCVDEPYSAKATKEELVIRPV